MSYNNPRATIAGLSLWDLNPNDIAMKNDFQDNLISLATDLLSRLVGVKPKVLKGMSSLAKLKSKTPNPNYLEKRYCSANALCVTWEGFNKEETKTVLRDILGAFENKISILIHDDSIEAYRCDKREIQEAIDGEIRTFFVYESE